MKQQTVSGKVIDMRSDHLIAVLNYALEQAEVHCIDVLDFGCNENALDSDEQLKYIQESLAAVKQLVADGNQDLLIVKASDEDLTAYHKA